MKGVWTWAPCGKTSSGGIIQIHARRDGQVLAKAERRRGTVMAFRASRILMWCLAATMVIGLAACENDPSEVAALFTEGRQDAEVITNFETIYSDSAQIRVRIRGPQLLRFEEDNQFIQYFPKGAEIEFFDDFGEISSTLRCGYGVRYESDERITLRDSVVWTSSAGDRLDTEELHWIAKDSRIYSDRFVRLRQLDKEITGVGFESNENFTRAKVVAIQGIVSVKDGGASTSASRDTLP